MSVEINIDYQGDLHCRAVHGPSGEELYTDAPVDNGGQGATFSPTDLVATALGTCIVTIMGLVADKRGLDISGTQVHVTKEMVPAPGRRIGTLTVTVTLPQRLQLTDEDRTALEKGAHRCPVHHSLHPETSIVVDFKYPQ